MLIKTPYEGIGIYSTVSGGFAVCVPRQEAYSAKPQPFQIACVPTMEEAYAVAEDAANLTRRDVLIFEKRNHVWPYGQAAILDESDAPQSSQDASAAYAENVSNGPRLDPKHPDSTVHELDSHAADEAAADAHVAGYDARISHPPHYTSHPSGVECIQITEHMGFLLGNAVKYIWRADLKGSPLEDLLKAQWYLAREIANRESAAARAAAAAPMDEDDL